MTRIALRMAVLAAQKNTSYRQFKQLLKTVLFGS